MEPDFAGCFILPQILVCLPPPLVHAYARTHYGSEKVVDVLDLCRLLHSGPGPSSFQDVRNHAHTHPPTHMMGEPSATTLPSRRPKPERIRRAAGFLPSVTTRLVPSRIVSHCIDTNDDDDDDGMWSSESQPRRLI